MEESAIDVSELLVDAGRREAARMRDVVVEAVHDESPESFASFEVHSIPQTGIGERLAIFHRLLPFWRARLPDLVPDVLLVHVGLDCDSRLGPIEYGAEPRAGQHDN